MPHPRLHLALILGACADGATASHADDCDHATAAACAADPGCAVVEGRVVDEPTSTCADPPVYVGCLSRAHDEVWCPDADTTAWDPAAARCVAFSTSCHDGRWDPCPVVSDLFSCPEDG